MSRTLSDETIALVKATVPALEAHGLDIVREMYARMFENPDIRDLFNQSHHGDSGSQPRALTGAILAYASNIDNLGALAPAVERIVQKHVGLQILPEHYPHVGEALLGRSRPYLAMRRRPRFLMHGARHTGSSPTSSSLAKPWSIRSNRPPKAGGTVGATSGSTRS